MRRGQSGKNGAVNTSMQSSNMDNATPHCLQLRLQAPYVDGFCRAAKSRCAVNKLHQSDFTIAIIKKPQILFQTSKHTSRKYTNPNVNKISTLSQKFSNVCSILQPKVSNRLSKSWYSSSSWPIQNFSFGDLVPQGAKHLLVYDLRYRIKMLTPPFGNKNLHCEFGKMLDQFGKFLQIDCAISTGIHCLEQFFNLPGVCLDVLQRAITLPTGDLRSKIGCTEVKCGTTK